MSKSWDDVEDLQGLTKLSPEELQRFREFQKEAFPPQVTKFSYAVQNWLSKSEHSIPYGDDITPEAWRGWLSYDTERRQAHDAKAEFDFATLPQAVQDAASEQWAHEYHGYFDFMPNTKTEFDALLKRCYARRDKERMAADLAAATKAKEHAEQRRLKALVVELKAHELPPLDLPPPDYERLRLEQKNPEKAKRRLLTRWKERFDRLPDHVSYAWTAYYTENGSYLVKYAGADEVDGDDEDEASGTDSSYYGVSVYLTPDPERENIYEGVADTIAAGLRDPSFEEFRKFSESVRRVYNMLDDDLDALINPPDDAYQPLGLRTLDGKAYQAQTFQNTGSAVLPGVIPKGLTIVYGDPKHGKSAWLQKLALCVADDRAKFEGLDIEHGPVAYVTLDIGAEFGDFQGRVLQIRERLGLPFSRDLAATDDQMRCL